jgi:tyrosine-protein phosphatase YwqE
LEIKSTLEKEFRDLEDVETIITVPAYFTSSQIDETKRAAENAGYLVKRIITEPVAAALAYGFNDDLDQKIFIVDIGGGTFDTAILEVKNYQFNTLAIGGDNHLGGDNFDEIIYEMFLKGYTPILAHPERYVYWHNTFSKYRELKNIGLLFPLLQKRAPALHWHDHHGHWRHANDDSRHRHGGQCRSCP